MLQVSDVSLNLRTDHCSGISTLRSIRLEGWIDRSQWGREKHPAQDHLWRCPAKLRNCNEAGPTGDVPQTIVTTESDNHLTVSRYVFLGTAIGETSTSSIRFMTPWSHLMVTTLEPNTPT